MRHFWTTCPEVGGVKSTPHISEKNQAKRQELLQKLDGRHKKSRQQNCCLLGLVQLLDILGGVVQNLDY